MNTSEKRTVCFNGETIALTEQFDHTMFEHITWSYSGLSTHHDIARSLKHKHPYTITVIIETLNWKLRNRKEYVIKTKTPIISKYRELLYEYFFNEFGQNNGNDVFAKWLTQYHDSWNKTGTFETIDEYIMATELEPRYRQMILDRYKKHEKLFKNRIRIDRERRYNLPDPFTRIDYRNSFDNYFVWEENGQKVARKGGSGSSGQRETNSKFIYGLLELSNSRPVPSYLFLYSEENTLLFVKKFETLTVPAFDIGSNYHLEQNEVKKLEPNGIYLRWSDYNKVTSIETSNTVY